MSRMINTQVVSWATEGELRFFFEWKNDPDMTLYFSQDAISKLREKGPLFRVPNSEPREHVGVHVGPGFGAWNMYSLVCRKLEGYEG